MAKKKSFTPLSLYKYASIDDAIKIFEGGSLKVTDPKKFNDPFDCVAPEFNLKRDIFLTEIRERLKIELRKECPKYYSKMLSWVNGQQVNNEVDFFIIELEKLFNNISETWSSGVDSYRVLSLAESRENILMWSHYAASHSGVVIEFDVSCDIFSDAKKVRYSNIKSMYDGYLNHLICIFMRNFSLKKNDDSDLLLVKAMNDWYLNLLENLLFLKREEWRYENEYRIVLPVDSDLITAHATESGGISTIKFQQKSVMSMTFGVNSNLHSDRVIKLVDILREYYPDVTLFQSQKKGLNLLMTNFI